MRVNEDGYEEENQNPYFGTQSDSQEGEEDNDPWAINELGHCSQRELFQKDNKENNLNNKPGNKRNSATNETRQQTNLATKSATNAVSDPSGGSRLVASFQYSPQSDATPFLAILP